MSQYEIPVGRKGFKATIDLSDLALVAGYKWSAFETRGLRYANTKYNGKTIYMHRLILDAKKGEYVDHINGNGLDNRQENLRITSQGVNLANAKAFSNNTSGYRGVIWFRAGWRAQVKHKGQPLQSGKRPNREDAALLRDELARRIWGKHIYLNFPDQIPPKEIVKEADRLLAKRDWL